MTREWRYSVRLYLPFSRHFALWLLISIGLAFGTFFVAPKQISVSLEAASTNFADRMK